jgi:cytidylate kinase
MSLPFNIAIDGHSSCGKSTIAKSIASKYGMRYIDTGAMYRAITLYCMRQGIIKNKAVDLQKLIKSLDDIKINFNFNLSTNQSETFLNKENVERLIRGIEVSGNVSIVAQIQIVREKLIILQQEIGKQGNVVMDGRDIGSKVFPDAKLKFFVTAKAKVRAKRRYDEMITNGEDVTLEEVLTNLNKRDEQDTNREHNPLIKSKDAIVLDNSELSLSQQNQFINQIIKNKLSE